MSLRRIVVALDAEGPPPLETAIELARSLEVELVALFVEDTELINLAALAFGEVGFPSAIRRALDVDAMERSLRATARRIHEEIGSRLAGNRIKWTFEVVRGRLASALATVSLEGDIVVVPAARTATGTPGARGRTVRTLRAPRVPSLLVCDPLHADGWIAIVPPPGAAMHSVARVVAALAPHYGRSALFVLADGEATHGTSWRHDVQQLLAGRGVSVRFRELADDTRAALDRLIAEEHPGIVVVLAGTPEAREALLA